MNLQRLEERIEYLANELVKKQRIDKDHVFVDQVEFCQIMNIEKSTAYVWRNQGLISYSKIGKTIYYKMTDIIQFLDNHRIEARHNGEKCTETANTLILAQRNQKTA